MSALDTAEYRRLALIAAGVDPCDIPCILDTATWRRLMLQALYDLSQGGGGSPGYITGSVQFYTDLPVTVGTPAVNTAYLVRENSGVWFINRKPAGIYVRLFNNGNLNDWDYAGTFPEVNDAQYFRIYDSADPTREVAFNVSGVAAATTRTLTVPNANGTIALTSDIPPAFNPASPGPIGSTTRNSGAFTTLSAVPSGGSTALTLTGGTAFISNPVLDATQTWNNAAVTFTGVNIAITESAYAAGSRFFDVKTGATSIFSLRNLAGNGSNEVLGIQGPSRGFVFGAQGTTTGSGFFSLRWQFNIAGLARDAMFAWGTDVYALQYDLAIQRDAADTLAQRRSTNPQTFRLYNTYTDASNHERGFMRWSSNVLQIGTEKAGTGSARVLEFQTDGATRLSLSTNDITRFHGDVPAIRGNSSGNIYVLTGNVNEGVSGGSSYIGGGSGGSSLFRIGTSNAVSLEISGGTSPLVRFGGTTSSFPALKRSSTTLQVRLADDSGYTVLDAQLRAQGTAPATSGATGTAGDIRYDADYIYVCTAANTWKRAAIATW